MASGSKDDRASSGASNTAGAPTQAASTSQNSILQMSLDENSILRRRPEVEHERAVALFDLLERNTFELLGEGATPGPYHVNLALKDDKLVFSVAKPDGTSLSDVALAIRPFRSIIKDYFLICESYFDAIKTMAPSQIEAIDMGRRGLHNEGAQLLEERLGEFVSLDHATARRLFTLLCVLHMRG
jgi:uncharacterized protein (UPF0262 family)